ncbi:solute carrier 6 (neurotransmitter transporter) [Chamberlinius hualienensis]
MEDILYDDSDVGISDEEDVEEKCQRRNSKLQKIIFLVGTAVNFGVMWRFTYVMHKDGGAIFIVPYFVMLTLIGLPLCCLDMMLGRCSELGSIRVWELTKISAGVGYALAGVATLATTYSGVITSWAFFYLFSSFRKDLPWTCNGSKIKRVPYNCTQSFNSNWTDAENDLTLSENFFLRRVVNVHYKSNIENFHDFKYSVVSCLAITWICTSVILGKGIRTAHKLAFSGVILVTLMLCLTGGTTIKESGYENIKRFLSVNWSELLSVEPWYDAVAQVLFSIGPGYSWLTTVAYNKSQSSNIFTDCYLMVMLQGIFSFVLTCAIVVVTGAQTTTSQYLSHFDIYQSDIGYVFVLFAARLARLPGSCLWCAIFFLGMALMGLAANTYFLFGIYYWIVSLDCMWLHLYRKFIGAVAICLIMFSLGLLLTTSGGYLVLRAIDQRLAELCAPLIAVLECLIIGWLYGGKRFSVIVEGVTGHKSRIPWRFMWEFVTPAVIISILLSKWVNDDDDNEVTHKTSFLIGRIIADLTPMCIPLYAIVLFIFTCFGPNKRVGQLFSASHKWARFSSVNQINSCAFSKQRKRHYGDSDPVVMVRVEDPTFGEIPHGFFYNPNKKNLTDILQKLPLINHHVDSDGDGFEDKPAERYPIKHHETSQNFNSKRSRSKTSDTNITLNYSLISHDGSTPVIVARKLPYPAALSLTNLPSLVLLPPHDISASEGLASVTDQIPIVAATTTTRFQYCKN